MWLLKAVGVHDQHDFTFALERGRSYKIGRDKNCDIQFNSKRLRTLEGTLEIGDWSLTEPNTKPLVKYKVEPKKGKKEYPPYNCLIITNEEELGSTNLDEYDKLLIEGGGGGTQSGAAGAFLSDSNGQGVYYADDAWFTLIWRDMYIVWDKMKDETDELRESLKKYCIAWTPSYEPDSSQTPNYVISSTLKANQECNYAVCNAIRILLPTFLRDVVRNLNNCWKTRADSQDSFSIPDEQSGEYVPPFDAGLQKFRANLESWLPDERRKTLFRGWKIMILRSKAQPGEKRYLLATGAEIREIDIITQPLASATDFQARINSWVKEVDESEGGRNKALVGFFGQVKKNVTDSGKDFQRLVEAPCHTLGIAVVPGSIIWHAMRLGSVQAYVDSNPEGPRTVAATTTQLRRTQVPETAAIAETRSLTPLPDTAGPSPASPTQRPAPASVIAETELTKPDTNMEQDPEPEPPSAQPPSTARRTLKRRAGKPMIDLYVEPIAETVDDAQGSLGSEPKSQDIATQPPSAQPALTQSYVPESVMPSQTQSFGRSRLKRRAGTQTPMVDYTIPEQSMMPSTQDMRPEIKEIYDQAMSSRADQPSVPKRARLASVDEGSREQTPVETQVQDGGMEVDENGDEGLDFVEKTLKDAAKAKKEGRQASRILMPPPTTLPAKTKTRRTGRSPSEETEPLEPPRRKASSPIKRSTQKTQSTKIIPPSTQDTAFLTAIAKNAKSKKAVDELDKEFNQLRIPKPGANPGSNVIKASAWDANHPDWNLVNEFDDDMRGNFIQIVRMDLMRKDGGRKVAESANDGKPNFKKFKKKEVIRREPVRMVLAAPSTNDAEMGEPYWPTQQSKGKGKGKTQTSLTQQMDEDEDEDMPLLPKSRRRLLSQGHDDEMSPPPPTARQKRGGPSQTPAASQAPPPRRATHRQLRETSVTSDTSSVGRGTRATTRATLAATQRSRKGKAEPIVIEESEDEVNRDLGPARSSTGTARGKSTRGTATGSGIVGDDEASTTTAIATRGRATPSSLGTGRRRLVVDDDDDGELGAAKKRRL